MKRVAAVALLAAIAAASVGHVFAARARDRVPPDDEVLFVPNQDALRFVSLGQHELLADLLYIRAVIYFGNAALVTHKFGALVPLIDDVIELDPQWRTPYRWGGVATMYNGQPVTDAGVAQSSRFLRKGVKQFPNDWELSFMLGCNLLFETRAKDAAEQSRLTAEGEAFIQRASLVGGAPSWAALLAATILRKEGREDAALRHLEQVYYATSNEQTRLEVRNRLISLKAKIDFEREGKERAQLEKSWNDSLPYVSQTLFFLLGPRPTPELDWHRLAVTTSLLPTTD